MAETKKKLPLWAMLLAGLLAALLTGWLLIWLSTDNPYSPEDLLDNSFFGENTDGAPSVETEDPNFGVPQFESGSLDPLVVGAARVYGPAGAYYRDKDGQIYAVDGPDISFFSGQATDPSAFGDCVAYRDSLNALRVTAAGKEYICADVAGDTVWVFLRENLLYVLSREGDRLLLNRYNGAGEKVGYDNAPVSLYTGERAFTSAEFITARGTGAGSFYAEAEGERLYGRLSDVEITGSGLLLHARPLPQDAQYLYGLGEIGGVLTPLYYREGDVSRLWFVKGDGTVGALEFPEGLSAEGLRRAYWGEPGVLIFRDGSVYRVSEGVLVRDEVLSPLSGKIVDLYLTPSGELRVLLTDGVLYRVA